MEKAGVVTDGTSGSVASASAAVCLGAVPRATETAADSPRGQPGECRPTELERRRRDANCACLEGTVGGKGTGLGWPQSRGEDVTRRDEGSRGGSPGRCQVWDSGYSGRCVGGGGERRS